MISSMTGFGRGISNTETFSLEAEIKSFNSRYLDLSIKLPKELSDKEFEIRELVRKKIRRGKVSVFIQIKAESSGNTGFNLDQKKVEGIVQALGDIKKYAGLQDAVTLRHILELKEFLFEESFEDKDKIFENCIKAVNTAIDDLNSMRKKEGAELENDLLLRLSVIENSINRAEELGRKPVEDYFARLIEKAKQLVAGITEYGDRLETELALLAERYDVTEENVRMRSHIKMFRDVLQNDDESGRKLNFICQEMNREANTINSKSVSTELSGIGITIKEELEKIREQVQNIE